MKYRLQNVTHGQLVEKEQSGLSLIGIPSCNEKKVV
jgi:hypothetical protein